MDLVAIAVIKRAVGLDGLCGILPHGETLARLKTPAAVYVGEDERRAVEHTLEELVNRPQGYAARFGGINDRTAAERVQGQNVYITEEKLPKLDNGQYYHFHLKGMTAVSESSNEKIGMVKDAVNLPSTDALEILLMNGQEIIVPYNEQAVIRVDDEKKLIILSDSYIEELL